MYIRRYRVTILGRLSGQIAFDSTWIRHYFGAFGNSTRENTGEFRWVTPSWAGFRAGHRGSWASRPAVRSPKRGESGQQRDLSVGAALQDGDVRPRGVAERQLLPH